MLKIVVCFTPLMFSPIFDLKGSVACGMYTLCRNIGFVVCVDGTACLVVQQSFCFWDVNYKTNAALTTAAAAASPPIPSSSLRPDRNVESEKK